MLARKTYLISASLGPISRRARANLDGYLDAWGAKGAPDLVWFEDIFPRMRGLKASFARLAGCDPDELAITTNISIAIATIASALEFGERTKVVMSELDFPTDGHVWLAQRRRGVEIEWLRSPDGLTIPLEEYDRAIDERTALVMVNRVLYRSSAIVDAKEVCRIARERGALSFLDDYHGIGIVPLDLHDLGCDLYAAGVLKWLCGGPGLAFLYARRDVIPTLEPAVTGWFGTAAALLVRHRAPRVPPDGPALRARHAAGPRVLPRAGRARRHRGGDPGADPGPAGRADGPRDRARRRARPAGPDPARADRRAAAS